MNDSNQQNNMPNWNTLPMPVTAMWPWIYYMQNVQNMANPNQTPWSGRWGNPPINEQPMPPQQEKPMEQPKSSNGPSVSCRIVLDINEVKPGEIPMDGSVGVFVKSDLSGIYLKQWGSDGNLHTKTFVEYVEEPATREPSNGIIPKRFLEEIDSRLLNLEEAICNLSQPTTTGSSNSASVSTPKKSKNNLKTGVD